MRLLLRRAAVHPLRFSGKTLSTSEKPALESSSTFINRCFAAFNFVADPSLKSEESAHSGVEIENSCSEKASRNYEKQMKLPQPKFAFWQHGASLVNIRAKTAPTQQSVLLPRWEDRKYYGSKSPPIDEDDFSELGMPVIRDGDAGDKYVNKTHKTSLSTETSGHPFLHFLFKTEDHHGNSGVKNDTETWKCHLENEHSHKIKNMVIVEEIPSSLTLSELIIAAKAYGNISSASMREGPNGFKFCDIEFKSVESMKRALMAQHVSVRSHRLPIRSLQTPKIVTVRISNISLETTESSIHSACQRYGAVVGLVRSKEGAVEVLFSICDLLRAEDIVKKLNNVSIDDCKWSAQLISTNISNATTDVDDAKCGVESQILSQIGGLKKQIQMKKIYLEDLEELHQALVHIRDCPSVCNLEEGFFNGSGGSSSI